MGLTRFEHAGGVVILRQGFDSSTLRYERCIRSNRHYRGRLFNHPGHIRIGHWRPWVI